jgi:hypothetical protein
MKQNPKSNNSRGEHLANYQLIKVSPIKLTKKEEKIL